MFSIYDISEATSPSMRITVPEYLVPNDNTYGTLHGPDRNHPEFASSVYAEQQRAQDACLAEILGHATIIKPLPESGGTIYFDATGTDSRSGDSFKLLLETGNCTNATALKPLV